MEHVHESPLVMTVPLMLLAVGAVFAGWAFHEQMIGPDWKAFWGDAIQIAASNHVLHDMEDVPGWVSLAPLVVGLAGIATAYLFYMFRPGIPAALAAAMPWAYRFLLNKWYFDELYAAVIVRPLQHLAQGLWQIGDVTIIDGVPNGLASLTEGGSAQIVKVQNGSIAVYAFAMLIGLVLLVSIFLLFLR
jgi:NADH-quinone oxidoreductase subunit L